MAYAPRAGPSAAGRPVNPILCSDLNTIYMSGETLDSTKRPARRTRIQTSYLKRNIEQCLDCFHQLERLANRLEKENGYLRTKLTTAEHGVAVLDEQLAYCVAVRCALSRYSNSIIRHQQRQDLKLSSLPPPQQWGSDFMARFNAMHLEECRFMIVMSLEDAGRLLKQLERNPELLPELEIHTEKAKRMCRFLQLGDRCRWNRITNCNLKTGSLETPVTHYHHLAASIPPGLISSTALSDLELGLLVLQNKVSALTKQRSRLGKELSGLLQATAASRHAVDALMAFPQDCEARQLLQRYIPADQYSTMDTLLLDLEATFAQENHARVAFIEFAVPKLPANLMIAFMAASSPYLPRFPLLVSIVLRTAKGTKPSPAPVRCNDR